MNQIKCEPCHSSMPKMSPEECQRHLSGVPDWSLDSEATEISRRFRFKNFVLAMTFANRIAELAEEMGHHPILKIGWGFCEVMFKTAKIGGLHANDFIMASLVDKLAQ